MRGKEFLSPEQKGILRSMILKAVNPAKDCMGVSDADMAARFTSKTGIEIKPCIARRVRSSMKIRGVNNAPLQRKTYGGVPTKKLRASMASRAPRATTNSSPQGTLGSSLLGLPTRVQRIEAFLDKHFKGWR